MFERFTKQARETVIAATTEAQNLDHPQVGTEHLLLAMLRPSAGIARDVLGDVGLTHDQARAEVQRLIESGRGLLGESDAAALEAIGIDLDVVRAKIEETFGPGALQPPPATYRRGLFRRRVMVRGHGGHRPFTPRAKKVLELSLREALALKHNYIGTEHLLLGLVREGKGLAAQVLANAKVDVDALRRSTIAAVDPPRRA